MCELCPSFGHLYWKPRVVGIDMECSEHRNSEIYVRVLFEFRSFILKTTGSLNWRGMLCAEFRFRRRGRLEPKVEMSEGIERTVMAESRFWFHPPRGFSYCGITSGNQTAGHEPFDRARSLVQFKFPTFWGPGDPKNVKDRMFEVWCVWLCTFQSNSSAYHLFWVVAAKPGGIRPPDQFHSKELDLCFKKVSTCFNFFGTRPPGNPSPGDQGMLCGTKNR